MGKHNVANRVGKAARRPPESPRAAQGRQGRHGPPARAAKGRQGSQKAARAASPGRQGPPEPDRAARGRQACRARRQRAARMATRAASGSPELPYGPPAGRQRAAGGPPVTSQSSIKLIIDSELAHLYSPLILGIRGIELSFIFESFLGGILLTSDINSKSFKFPRRFP